MTNTPAERHRHIVNPIGYEDDCPQCVAELRAYRAGEKPLTEEELAAFIAAADGV